MRPQPSQATLQPGALLAKRYRIEQLIGSGGYANVYRGNDVTLGFDRAIKEVVDSDAGVRDQFRLEAELLINSVHPNIPHGYHILEENGRLYLVMDYVKGPDLEELLNESLTKRQRPLDEERVLEWAMAICGALDEMHSRRVPVIHRDIKPANIKITPGGEPILIDFGLAKLHSRNGPTMTAAQGVSPGFAPPEQYMAKGRTDARTDMYGLGATLYACLTGKDPPEAPGRLLAQTGAGGTQGMHLLPLRKLNPRVSDATERVVMRALELSPTNRQQSARQMREELHGALSQLRSGQPATAVMEGIVCHRCGTENKAESLRCVHCGAPLNLGASGKHAAQSPDATGKRAAAGVGLLSSAKMAAVPAQAAAAAGANGGGGRTGRHAAVAQASGKQQAVGTAMADPERRSGKQRAVGRGSAGPGAGGPAPALPALAAAGATREGAAVAALPVKPGRATGQGRAVRGAVAGAGAVNGSAAARSA
ncbi:MAG TPA: protein kinase, partial [Ktedonobacterales bacterium]